MKGETPEIMFMKQNESPSYSAIPKLLVLFVTYTGQHASVLGGLKKFNSQALNSYSILT